MSVMPATLIADFAQLLLGILLCAHLLFLLYPCVSLGTRCPVPFLGRPKLKVKSKVPVSVNYHFTRRCNKTCGFCFHTATTSHIEELPQQKHALRLLADAGMRKINFAGGEPFLYPKVL